MSTSTAASAAESLSSDVAVAAPKPAPSFYRRPLPSTCVALSSRAGRHLFQSALAGRGLKSFFRLIEQHTTQGEPAYCGVSTLTVCLNAFAVDPRQTWKGPWRWYEESMLNCCVDLDDVKRTGITMSVFHCLAQCQGLTSRVYYAQDESSTVEHFREQVRVACVEAEEGDDDSSGSGSGSDDHLHSILVVSYNRRGLGQSGTGHFSPIGAYDAASDSVLILDTARFKYGVHWVSLPLLYEAMQSIDPDSGRSRGYIMLSHDREDYFLSKVGSSSASASMLPMSILFRTTMKKHESRRRYKEFLRGLQREPTWEEVFRFWTRDFTDPEFVWTAVDPQVKPCTNENGLNALVDQVRDLIAKLVPTEPPVHGMEARTLSTLLSSSSEPSSCLSSCRPNGLRTINLKPDEPIFVSYLAALDEDRRAQIVNAAASNGPFEEARRQLLAEAELVRYAIDLSYQQPSMTA
jgi:glutathione gamma-glutamylcysteinyltransferase